MKNEQRDDANELGERVHKALYAENSPKGWAGLGSEAFQNNLRMETIRARAFIATNTFYNVLNGGRSR